MKLLCRAFGRTFTELIRTIRWFQGWVSKYVSMFRPTPHFLFPWGCVWTCPPTNQQLYDECPGTPLRPNTMAQMKAMKTSKQGTDHGTRQMRTWCYAVCIVLIFGIIITYFSTKMVKAACEKQTRCSMWMLSSHKLMLTCLIWWAHCSLQWMLHQMQ